MRQMRTAPAVSAVRATIAPEPSTERSERVEKRVKTSGARRAA